jgi:hypothetical protein
MSICCLFDLLSLLEEWEKIKEATDGHVPGSDPNLLLALPKAPLMSSDKSSAKLYPVPPKLSLSPSSTTAKMRAHFASA